MANPAEPRSFVAGEGDAGQRLDRWLSDQVEGLSRSRVQKLIEAGEVTVDGEARPGRHRLSTGERIQLVVPAAEPVEGLEPDSSVPFEIVYEDPHLAVVDKPAGVVVHPAPGHRRGTLVQGLMARLDALSGVGGRLRPGIVHRLDRETSGLLVVARNDAAHRSLQAQLQDRSLGRTYQAIVWGQPDPPGGTLDFPLDRHPRQRERRAVVEGGRPARTHYGTLETRPGATLLELRLESGRTHQIRVHLAHVGHPVLGDPLYWGDARRLKGAHPDHRPALQRALGELGRQALHACRLRLVHPATGEQMEFASPLPPDIRAALDQLAP